MKKTTLIHLFCIFVMHSLFSAVVNAELSPNLLKDAESGKAAAQYSIARSYELGKRVKSDKEKAIFWYTKAADQGHVDASYRLGLLYYKGLGGFKIDLKKAFQYISKAANKNHKNSQANLAKMYANGDGVGRNEAMSDYWYEQAFTAKTQSFAEYIKEQEKSAEPVAKVIKPPKAKVIKKTVKAPVVTSTPSKKKISLQKTILSANWFQGGKASAYLKSSTTKCKKKGDKVSCSTSKLTGKHSTGMYKYKLRSNISKGRTNKDIKIQYRKLYVSVPEETIGGYDDEDESESTTGRLVVGWEKSSHSINCRFESSTKILCRPVGEDAFYIKGK